MKFSKNCVKLCDDRFYNVVYNDLASTTDDLTVFDFKDFLKDYVDLYLINVDNRKNYTYIFCLLSDGRLSVKVFDTKLYSVFTYNTKNFLGEFFLDFDLLIKEFKSIFVF